MNKPATRLLTLITLLQRFPNQKAPDLAGQLGISVRSLHRYMEKLDQMGIPIYSERGRYGGFSLMRGYKLPPLVFTADEAVAISLGTHLVEQMWGELYADAAHSVIAKLDNLLPEGQRSEVAWAQRTLVSSALRRPQMDKLTRTLEKLRQAMRTSHQVEMTYQGRAKAETTKRRFDPYVLVFRSGWWYVVGYCHLRTAIRIFRLDHITELTLLDAPFVPPLDFDVRPFLVMDSNPAGSLHVRLRFSAEMAFLVQESAFTWHEVEQAPDGSITAVMDVPDLTWAASTAMSFGPGVEVLEPARVRREVKKWAKAILEQYS